MDAPKCKVCGKAEWNHLCSGPGTSEIERRSRPKPDWTRLREKAAKELKTSLVYLAAKEPVTVTPVTKPAPPFRNKGGRPKIGDTPLTAAERMKRMRSKKTPIL